MHERTAWRLYGLQTTKAPMCTDDSSSSVTESPEVTERVLPPWGRRSIWSLESSSCGSSCPWI